MSLAVPGSHGIHQESGRRSMPAKKRRGRDFESCSFQPTARIYSIYCLSPRSTIEAGEASHFPVKIVGGDSREAFDISICM